MDWCEHYEGILCVKGGWLYKVAEVFSYYQYKNYTQRGPFVVRRRGGGRGRPALIEWRSIPEDYRQQLIERYGNPEESRIPSLLEGYLEQDAAASKYYKAYRLDSGGGLPGAHIAQYSTEAAILNAVHQMVSQTRGRRHTLGGQAGGLWEKASELVNDLDRSRWPHKLPGQVRSLRRKLKSYQAGGYEGLIHKNFCNKNSEKVNEQAGLWLVARWSDRVRRAATLSQLFEEYNQRAAQQGWKKLENPKTLYNFLYDEKIIGLWYGYRHGELKAKERNLYQFSTKLPQLRDALWYGDGTKLNYFFLGEGGKVQTCQVYEVMDAYSEVLLGYHISPQEDFAAQYAAYKMALQYAGHRPYQIGCDNQGGHKKLESGNFLNKICKLAIKTQPYNGKSKTIESAFGRFQSKYLARDWFFTGQNITAKKTSSQANLEMIQVNKANLPSLEEIKSLYARRRQAWNQAPHPISGLPRINMYESSCNDKAPAVALWDMVDWFWVQHPKPISCTPYGISFTHKRSRYTYMVHTEQGYPDQKWLREHIDSSFYVKYDPEDMTLIYLYEKSPQGLRFVSKAETKREIHRAKQEQDPEEIQYIKQVERIKQADRLWVRDKVDTLQASLGMRAGDYGLVSLPLKGIERDKTKGKATGSFAKVQKRISQAVAEEQAQEDLNIYDYM